jgi:hypothetical protein
MGIKFYLIPKGKTQFENMVLRRILEPQREVLSASVVFPELLHYSVSVPTQYIPEKSQAQCSAVIS